MSNSDRTPIMEDKPRMRSMQIMSAQPAPIVRASPIAKQPLLAHVPSTNQPKVSLSSGWNVGPLVPVPPIYPLERTHVTVDDSADKVAQRVADCLRNESISTTYSNEEALVEAETVEHTQFTVRLWEGKNGQVLVEVQKVAGCCFLFCQAAKTVLRAAKGIQEPPKRRTFSIPPCVPRDEQESQVAVKESIEIVRSLLKGKQIDAHILAMESLNQLSAATENKCFTARCILSGDFRQTLLTLIESFRLADEEATDKQHLQLMRRHALAILANCLAALEQSGELVQLLQQQEELTSNPVLVALIDEVAAAQERPHSACEAAKCLLVLLKSSEETKRQADAIGAYETISQARQMGVCRHAALEDICSKLRTLL